MGQKKTKWSVRREVHTYSTNGHIEVRVKWVIVWGLSPKSEIWLIIVIVTHSFIYRLSIDWVESIFLSFGKHHIMWWSRDPSPYGHRPIAYISLSTGKVWRLYYSFTHHKASGLPLSQLSQYRLNQITSKLYTVTSLNHLISQ